MIIRPDWWLVRLDITAHVTMSLLWTSAVESFGEVYLFDRNRHVRCCELTPSYEMHPVELSTRFQPGCPDAAREQVLEEVQADASMQEREVKYLHVQDVEQKLAAWVEADQAYNYGDSGVSFEDTPYEDQLTSLVEHFQSNPRL